MKKIVVLLMILVTVLAIAACKVSGVETERQDATAEYAIEVVSALKGKDDCCICGNNDRSMMDYYRKSNMIGIVCLNTMDISNLDTREYSDDGSTVLEPKSAGNSVYNVYDGDVSVNINSKSNRGIFEAEISYGDNSKLDFDKVKEFLCQDCLDKVVALYEESMDWTDGEGRFPQICLIDFATNELYSLSSHQSGYYIRDFWVHIDHETEADRVMVIYAPEDKLAS